MNGVRALRWASAGMILGVAAFTPGCVVQDIHNELVAINANMKVTQDILLDASATLHDVQAQLDQVRRTNDLLVDLQAGLGTEQVAGTRSENRASIIGTMESIDRSLGTMDTHLSALRKTIANIDNTIPFLKFSADAEEEDAEEVGAEGPSGVEGEGEAGGQAGAAEPEAPAPSSPPNAAK